ncbi:BREX-1 system phosphatase PglZ type A [Deinococcus yavapaiensis]|uniref:Uncharacterized protein (TIGR02687 family) n=1 Tax=Deinococcus yavapaiensis KR-236 TaxID=694435 RepID=A0A318S278_9DEIO|nr:BREX-1 system phosphatase PglZ type A [Deinococcus yavapaiensis]PYE52026.1 uncharacterized protein (TIGR02687 family) [Deinococcus yavapaiensis KR-236]
MSTDRIQSSLKELFDADRHWPHEGRRVVFWYDAAGEFEETFDTLALPGVQRVRLADTPFTVKRRLLIDEPDAPFLLYAPFAEPAPHENWLYDVQAAGRVFSADRAAMLHADFGFLDRSLESFLRGKLRFFASKKREEAFRALGVTKSASAFDVLIAMLSVLVGLKVADAALVVRRVLMGGLDEPSNAVWNEVVKYVTPQEFWSVTRATLNFPVDGAVEPTLRRLFLALALTHLRRTFDGAWPGGSSPWNAPLLIEPPHAAFVFVDAWLKHAEDAPRFADLRADVEGDLDVKSVFEKADPSAFVNVETFEAFDELLLARLTDDARFSRRRADDVAALIERRRGTFTFPAYWEAYAAVAAAAEFLERESTLTSLPRDAGALFEAYARSLHRFDRLYRAFMTAAHASSDAQRDVLHDLIEHVERVYVNTVLDKVGEAWSDALAANVEGVVHRRQRQERFFDVFVKPILERGEKVFVIVSDALRYEVAEELRERLKVELRGEPDLTPLLGVLPSKTAWGMPALLPGEGLAWTAPDVIKRGGVSLSTLEKRSDALAATGIPARAMRLADLVGMRTEEGRALLQPLRLVYLYHNVIDALGDHAPSEARVLEACANAVEELTRAVKRLANTLNATHVILTADHGFLYQRLALESAEKLPLPKDAGVLVTDRRFVLGRGLAEVAGTIRVPLATYQALDAPDDLVGLFPRGALRFAVQGGGAQYVHGGASLQELTVPALVYKHVRAVKGDDGPSRKVGVIVAATQRRVTTNTFTVRLVQTDAVSDRVRPRTVTVALYDASGAAITDERTVALSSGSPHAVEREVPVRLTIARANLDSSSAYQLIVRDVEDGADVLREAWTVRLAISNDFGDF